MKKILFSLVGLGLLVIMSQSFAGDKKSTTNTKKTKAVALSILRKYTNAVAVRFNLEKKEHKKTLGTETTEVFTATYSNNKLRFSKKNPDVDIIYNKSLWIIESPDLDFDPQAKRKVTIYKTIQSDLVKQTVQILSKPDVFLNKADEITKENDMIKLVYNKDNEAIKNLVVELDVKAKRINKIFYIDEIETETTLSFSQTKFLDTVSQSLFRYKAKKDDEVITP